MKKILLLSTITISILFSAPLTQEEKGVQTKINEYNIELNNLKVEQKRIIFKKIEELEKKINEKTLSFEKAILFLKKYKEEDRLNLNEELRKIKREYKLDKASLLTEIEKVKNGTDNDLILLKLRKEINEKQNHLDELRNNYIMIKDEYELTKEQITKEFREKINAFKVEYKNNLLKLQELYKLQLNTIKNKNNIKN